MECGGLEVARKKVMSNYYYILSILKKKEIKKGFWGIEHFEVSNLDSSDL